MEPAGFCMSAVRDMLPSFAVGRLIIENGEPHRGG